MRRLIPLLVVGALLAACSGAGTADTTTTAGPSTTSAVATTTTMATTPTTPATTTTTFAATTTTTVPATTTTTFDSNQLADGSGCTPGTQELPDGVWYGYADSYDADGIEFDLACWFWGDAATIAAAEDGEESPPPNDYYVRNQNPMLRDLAVAADVPVRWYLSGDPNEFVDGTFPEWIEFLDTIPWSLGIWVTIEDGDVTDIEEMWVP